MTTIKLKNGSGAPTAGDLVQGEPALDLTNKRLYTEDSGGTVIEVGTNPTSVTTGDITATGTATFAGLTTTGDLSFGDNDKAIFGAGSDLQLYHDGSTSFIDDVGDGNLHIRTDGASIKLRTSANADMIVAENGGAAKLYHAGSQKLATLSTGIDVTGTVTADGLTVDASTTDMITLNHSTPSNLITIGQDSSGDFRVRSDSVNKLKSYANGDFELYEDTGTTAKFFWDAADERLGIGTTSPSKKLSIKADGGGSQLGIDIHNEGTATGDDAVISFETQGSREFTMGLDRSATSFVIAESSTLGSNQRLVIDDSGNVGIGTDSPAQDFHIREDSGDCNLLIDSANGASQIFFGDDESVNVGKIGYNHASNFMTFNVNASEAMRIDSSGNVGIGTDSPSSTLDVESPDGTTSSIEIQGGDGNSKNLIFRKASAVQGRIRTVSDALEFGIGSSATEAMRIDSSGNLLVGTTSFDSSNTGHAFSSSGGSAYHTRSGATVLFLNRLASTGTIVEFQQANTAVGTIAVTGSATAYNTSSDQRLKDNIVDAPSASDDIDAIQVRSFDWKVDGSHQKYGMVAQELQSVAPEAVSAPEDPEEMMGVDYSKLVPMLVKEIQSLRARVAQLEN